MKRALDELEASDTASADIEARDEFDSRYETDTQSTVEIYHLENLDLADDILLNKHRYTPTPIAVIDAMLSALDVEDHNTVFVDFGAGKGRVLLVAAHHPWKAVIGVEFSADLCKIAENNIRIFQQKQSLDSVISLERRDAVDFIIQSDPAVFLFDPFSNGVMGKVLTDIKKSLQTFPREVHLLIVGNKLRASLLDDDTFARVVMSESADHRNYDFCI